MIGTHKTRVIFRRNSNRIVIREASGHESWPQRRANQMSMDETIERIRDHEAKAISQIIKTCPYSVCITGQRYIDNNLQNWLEANTTDRFSSLCDHSINDIICTIVFKSKNDAIHFKLTWT